jgi:hypothetical protein
MEVHPMNARRLEALAGRVRPAPCVSLFIPLSNGADGSERARVALRGLADAAALELEVLSTLPRMVLGPLQRYTEERHAWPRDARGVGFFAARGTLEAYSVLHHVPALGLVGPRFHVRPLLGFSQGNGRFFLLVLSFNDPHLLEADRDNLVRVRLTGMPGRFGHGDASTSTNPHVWVREVASRVDRHVAPTGAPLVLACEESWHALYRETGGHAHVLDRPIAGAVEGVADEVLRDAAWERVAPLFSRRTREATRRYAQQHREGRSAASLRAVMDAAEAGRVETLFLLWGVRAWGHYGADGSLCELADREPGAEDLFDRVATLVLAAGGHVLEFSAVDMPTAQPIAATLRF